MSRIRRPIVLSLAMFVISCALAFAGLMLHSETTIPIPVPGEKTSLAKLEYRARFVASVDAVTLELASSDGGDPVIVEWTFVGSNTDGQVHRVAIALRLLDEAGSQIGVSTGHGILSAGAKDQKISVSMKVKPDVWKAAKKVRIFADWMS
ncbi:MAG TPA: hypothetical protein VF958_07960 [Thermoanaerobaculia bacterium]